MSNGDGFIYNIISSTIVIFRTLISGRLIEGGCLMVVQLRLQIPYLNKMVFLCAISHGQCVKANVLHLYFCRVCLLGLMTMEVVLLPF